jgi:hypothetical protein
VLTIVVGPIRDTREDEDTVSFLKDSDILKRQDLTNTNEKTKHKSTYSTAKLFKNVNSVCCVMTSQILYVVL